MARHPRLDGPGTTHHVFGRGLARRPIAEARDELRFLLSLFAREVRRGTIRVLAFSLLTTHFHVLIESVTGELPAVMQRVLNRYVREFNRRHLRDGPLFRSRYGSRPVRSWTYRLNVLRYIDRNAPKARLAQDPVSYPFGSAMLYASRRRPRWLATEWVDSMLGDPSADLRAPRYAEVLCTPYFRGEDELVEARMRSRAQAEDEYDDLVGMSAEAVQSWMLRKTRLADATVPGPAYACPQWVRERVAQERRGRGAWQLRIPPERSRDAWSVVLAGLLRTLAGLRDAQVAVRLGCVETRARRLYGLHVRWLRAIPAYAEAVARIAVECLRVPRGLHAAALRMQAPDPNAPRGGALTDGRATPRGDPRRRPPRGATAGRGRASGGRDD